MRKIIAAVTVLACLIPMLARAQNANQTLSTTTFVVVGDGLAAGMANMGLSADYQDKSFPAQMARQIKTAFPQPLLEAPGLGDPIGYQKLPVRVPTYPQGRVRI